jgi:hypothetical protein
MVASAKVSLTLIAIKIYPKLLKAYTKNNNNVPLLHFYHYQVTWATYRKQQICLVAKEEEKNKVIWRVQ